MTIEKKETKFKFILIPRGILYDKRLTPNARTLLCYLRFRQYKNPFCNPSYDRIKQDLHLNHYAIRQAIRRLLENGYLILKPGGAKRGSNQYQVHLSQQDEAIFTKLQSIQDDKSVPSYETKDDNDATLSYDSKDNDAYKSKDSGTYDSKDKALMNHKSKTITKRRRRKEELQNNAEVVVEKPSASPTSSLSVEENKTLSQEMDVEIKLSPAQELTNIWIDRWVYSELPSTVLNVMSKLLEKYDPRDIRLAIKYIDRCVDEKTGQRYWKDIRITKFAEKLHTILGQAQSDKNPYRIIQGMETESWYDEWAKGLK